MGKAAPVTLRGNVMNDDNYGFIDDDFGYREKTMKKESSPAPPHLSKKPPPPPAQRDIRGERPNYKARPCEVVSMPPYVEPAHRQMIDNAEKSLEEYSDYLMGIVKQELFDNGWVTEPRPEDIVKAEKRFHEDPIRMELAKNLASIKIMCERPRMLINKA